MLIKVVWKATLLAVLALSLSACEFNPLTNTASTGGSSAPSEPSATPSSAPDSQRQTQEAFARTQAALNEGAVNLQQTQVAMMQTQAAMIQTQAALNAAMPLPLAPMLVVTTLTQEQAGSGISPTATLTPPIPLSSSAGGLMDFGGAYIYSFSYLDRDHILVTIQLASQVQGNYYAMIRNQRFTCEVLRQYPTRLYCRGRLVKGGWQVIKVFEEGSNRLVFEDSFLIPVWTPTKTPLPTPKHGYTPTPWRRFPSPTPTP